MTVALVEGRAFDPRPRHTKDVIKWYQILPCLAHMRIGIASLSSQTLFKTEVEGD